MHESMAFIRERPVIIYTLKHNGKVVSVFENKRREDAEPVLPLGS